MHSDPLARLRSVAAHRARGQYKVTFAAAGIRSIIEVAASRYLQYPLATCHRPNRKNIEAMTDLDSIKIQRSYKFRCYPGSVQRQQLAVEFGHARWVWNQCLAWRSNLYQDVGEKVTAIDFSRELTFLKQLGTYDWLKEASACVLQQKLRDQDTAFRNFFAGRAKYPKFKRSYTGKASAINLING